MQYVVGAAGAPCTTAPSPTCSFAIHDNEGNDEFTFYLTVERVGTCQGTVQIGYTTNYDKNPSGSTTFNTSDTQKLITIPANCCAIGPVTYYNVNISVISGSAIMTDSSAIATVHGNG